MSDKAMGPSGAGAQTSIRSRATLTRRLEFEASNSPAGPASGQLSAGGTATLDGTLKLSLTTPYQPASGATFDLLQNLRSLVLCRRGHICLGHISQVII